MEFKIATADALELTDPELSELLTQVYVVGRFTAQEEAMSLFEPSSVRNRGGNSPFGCKAGISPTRLGSYARRCGYHSGKPEWLLETYSLGTVDNGCSPEVI